LLVDGDRRTTVDIPNTGGWESYTTKTISGVELPAGEHVLQLRFPGAAFNLNWFETTLTDSSGENGGNEGSQGDGYEDGEAASISEAIDENDDGDIDDTEILTALDHWQDEEPVPGTDGQTISETQILDLVDRWQDEESD